MEDPTNIDREFDESTAGEVTAWPPHKHAFQKLCAGDEVDYGITITWARLEELFGMKRELGDWKFRGEYLSLRLCFEEAGYLLTERGVSETGVRIMTREEMADVVRQREFNKANDSLRKSLTLAKVPRDGLPDAEVRKLDHWETKLAVIGATAKLLLRKRSLPSPQNAVGALKQSLENQQ